MFRGLPPPPPLAPFAPVTHSYTSPGSYTVTIPGPGTGTNGPSQMVIEMGGPGGGGSFSPYMTRSPQGVSGSGGSGAICRSVFALNSSNWGQTVVLNIQSGAAGGDGTVNFIGRNASPSTANNGSFSQGFNMQAGGGQGGTWNPGAGGAGGVASGANNANISGNTGQGNTLYPTPSNGGAAVVGWYISSGRGGNASIVANGNGSPGSNGAGAVNFS